MNMAASRVTHDHSTGAAALPAKFFLSVDQRSRHALIPDHRCLIHRPEVLLGSSVAPSQLIDNPLPVRWIVDDILLQDSPRLPFTLLSGLVESQFHDATNQGFGWVHRQDGQVPVSCERH